MCSLQCCIQAVCWHVGHGPEGPASLRCWHVGSPPLLSLADHWAVGRGETRALLNAHYGRVQYGPCEEEKGH